MGHAHNAEEDNKDYSITLAVFIATITTSGSIPFGSIPFGS